MAHAIQANKLYTVDFGRQRFQVRTLRPIMDVPGLWECISLFSGRSFVIPERAFVAEPTCLSAIGVA